MVLQVGEHVEARALHADGQAYPCWDTVVESVHQDRFVTWNWAGHRVEGPQGSWVSQGSIRAVYWPVVNDPAFPHKPSTLSFGGSLFWAHTRWWPHRPLYCFHG